MPDEKRDRQLGMDRPITRRDFLDGVAIGIGGALLGSSILGHAAFAAIPRDKFAPEKSPEYYPPSLQGMRGNHDGSYTAAHALRDGHAWNSAGPAGDSEKPYDLIVVGGGISGLAAAHFYRGARGKDARILILDNHDDFGGHAKRNEFEAGGRMVLSYGGTQSLENPDFYSAAAKQLIQEIGIDVRKFDKAYDRRLYSKLGTAAFFDRETFGADRLLTGMNVTPWAEFLAKAPLSEQAKRDIARVYTEKTDYLPGKSRQEKRAYLNTITYADFLTKICHVTPEALPFFQPFPHDLWAVGIDAVSALTCFEDGDDYGSFTYPGFDGLDLGESEEAEPYIFHFPDGNASVARLLVRSLIPGAVPGSTMEDVVTSRANYAKLDEEDSPVRLRLNSTAVHVHEKKGTAAAQVEVAYMRGGKLQLARARDCVLACYNMMIPYLCPELPAAQKEALAYLVKAPLVYTHVALRNWEPFARLGIHHIVSPGSYHTYTALDFPVSLGDYKFPDKPAEPAVLFMLRTPCRPGLPMRDQYRAGRYELLQTPFATFERNIRDQLQRMLGGAGFDPATDIDGITVNRWAHGYAYTPDALFDPPWKSEAEKPWVIGRQRFGRIAIANSDAGANAYTNTAIDQAFRAVNELLALA